MAHIDIIFGKLLEFEYADTIHSLRGGMKKEAPLPRMRHKGCEKTACPFDTSNIGSTLLDFAISVQQSIL
jgi:hypothetical protein